MTYNSSQRREAGLTMKSFRFMFPGLAIVALLSLVLPPAAARAGMLGLSTDTLVAESDAVVVGKVEDARPKWSADGKKIVTSCKVTLTEVVAGDETNRTVEVEYEGGEIDGLGMKVSDVAPLASGERVLLFLAAHRSTAAASLKPGKVYRMVGQAQGKYALDDAGVATKAPFSLIGPGDAMDRSLPVENLKEKVQQCWKTRAAPIEKP